MSIPADEAAALIAAYQTNLASTEAQWATLTLFVFEYLITFQYEVELLWRRKWTIATWLFWLTRYAMVASQITLLFPSDNRFRCNTGLIIYAELVGYILLFLSYVVVSVRVFALVPFGIMRYLLPSVIMLLGITRIFASLYVAVHNTVFLVDFPVLGPGCEVTTTVPIETQIHLGAASFAARIVADLIALIVTWAKTFRQVRLASSAGMNTGFSGVLLRDGSIFFVVSLALDIVSAFDARTPVTVTIESVTGSLQPILILRFLIHLRQIAGNSDETTTIGPQDKSISFAAPRFNASAIDSVIGNMGAPLDYGHESFDEDENESFGPSSDGTNITDEDDEFEDEDLKQRVSWYIAA